MRACDNGDADLFQEHRNVLRTSDCSVPDCIEIVNDRLPVQPLMAVLSLKSEGEGGWGKIVWARLEPKRPRRTRYYIVSAPGSCVSGHVYPPGKALPSPRPPKL